MNAVWYSSQLKIPKIGTGIVTGDVSEGYPGKYKVTYSHSDGANAGSFDLEIIKNDMIFELFWRKANEIRFVGVGIETPEGLIGGWRKADILK